MYMFTGMDNACATMKDTSYKIAADPSVKVNVDKRAIQRGQFYTVCKKQIIKPSIEISKR